MQEELLRVVLVMPRMAAEITLIRGDLETYQGIVEGYFRPVQIARSVWLYCNDDGGPLGFPPNRRLPGGVVIVGTFFLVSQIGGEAASLTPYHADFWRSYFNAKGAYR